MSNLGLPFLHGDLLYSSPRAPSLIINLVGSRDGALVRALASNQCVPGSIPGPGVICGFSLLLVLFLAPRASFSPGTPVFSSPQKPTFSNSNSIWNCKALYHEPLARVIAQALPVFDIKFAFTFDCSTLSGGLYPIKMQNNLLYSCFLHCWYTT